jgi:hypothetical protein
MSESSLPSSIMTNGNGDRAETSTLKAVKQEKQPERTSLFSWASPFSGYSSYGASPYEPITTTSPTHDIDDVKTPMHSQFPSTTSDTSQSHTSDSDRESVPVAS